MTQEERLKIEERIVEVLKTVYDPEIPVDVYNLGLIYRIDLHDDATLDVDMTLTAPNCPAAACAGYRAAAFFAPAASKPDAAAAESFFSSCQSSRQFS